MPSTKAAMPACEPVVEIKVAASSDELMMCYALRAAVFMGEQHCPYFEEFDGNDYTGTHILMLVDGEPAGWMRVRWFHSFCKLERAVILKPYRSAGRFIDLLHFSKDLARRKGYTKAYGHVQLRNFPIFERDGFRRVDDRVFHFSDHEYYSIVCDLEPVAAPPAIDLPPLVLNRPEGRLDEPGILELSQARAPTNPHLPRVERRAH